MSKAVVLLAPGFEEGEALFIVDILRRADIDCASVSTTERVEVTGGHAITVLADQILDVDELYKTATMVILPGGLPGADNLKADPRVLELVRRFDADPDKYVAAICAAPMVLKEAGITRGRKLTSYPSEKYRNLFTDADYRDVPVVIDGHLITSQGPATTLAFAYTLAEILGKDTTKLQEGMLYPRIAPEGIRYNDLNR